MISPEVCSGCPFEHPKIVVLWYVGVPRKYYGEIGNDFYFRKFTECREVGVYSKILTQSKRGFAETPRDEDVLSSLRASAQPLRLCVKTALAQMAPGPAIMNFD
jgi:hypothetical protein